MIAILSRYLRNQQSNNSHGSVKNSFKDNCSKTEEGALSWASDHSQFDFGGAEGPGSTEAVSDESGIQEGYNGSIE